MSLSDEAKNAIYIAMADVDKANDLIAEIDTVSGSQIVAGAVTKAKLATGIKAPEMVFAAGQFTTVGGDANEVIPVVNMLNTDTVLVAVMKPGAVARTIVSATAAAGEIDVVLSNDPSNDHILIYIVIRATA